LDEAVYIRLLQQQDEGAFRQLVDSWKDRIYNTALGIVQDESDADDITQEVLVKAWRALPTFRGDAKISTWLYRITVRQSVSWLRQRRKRNGFQWLSGFWNRDNAPDDAIDFVHPGVVMERRQEAALLFKAIRKLPEQQQIAYTLMRIEGLTMQEIGEILDLQVGAVESLLQRAKQHLRKQLLDYYNTHRYEQ
jgi:RNA polymerase sigma-70 factor (ECF subfamily)